MIDVLVEYLAECEMLLVLDTCEHLVGECALAAEAFLSGAPGGLRILVTSRRQLDVDGERLLTVEPLPVSESNENNEGEAAAETDAVALLAARAAEVVPGFTVTDTNRADLVRICRRLDGLPLAIELAAARLRELSMAELIERLHAAWLLGLSQQVWDTLGRPQAGVPTLIAARNACEQETRSALGDDAYEAAFRAGYDTNLGAGTARILRDTSLARHHPAARSADVRGLSAGHANAFQDRDHLRSPARWRWFRLRWAAHGRHPLEAASRIRGSNSRRT